MSRAVMQQALEALEYADACLKKQLTTKTKHEYAQDLLFAAGTALKQALAEPQTTHWEGCEAVHPECRKPEPEPCAMRYDFDGYGYRYIDSGSGSNWQTRHKDAEPLYAAPTPRKPVELTDEEIINIGKEARVIEGPNILPVSFARAVIAAYEKKQGEQT